MSSDGKKCAVKVHPARFWPLLIEIKRNKIKCLKQEKTKTHFRFKKLTYGFH
jgi:hypothetical protein